MRLLVLRPRPGAETTAAAARELGIDVVTAPLFTVAPLPWSPPDPFRFDAVMLTSANAARHAGEGLEGYRHLPLYAVGEASAAAAREAGFSDVVAGTGDAAALLIMIAAGAPRRVFHPCGACHRDVNGDRIEITHVPVYTARPADRLPDEARAACTVGAIVLVHSPRAAALFGELADTAGIGRAGVTIVAISAAAAKASGIGWREVVASLDPTDAAMLAIARRLCETRR